MNTKVNDRPFANFHDFILDVFAGFSHDLFDTGGVDTAVLHKPVQRKPGDFAPNGVKP